MHGAEPKKWPAAGSNLESMNILGGLVARPDGLAHTVDRLSLINLLITGFAVGSLDCIRIGVSNLSQPSGADQPDHNNQHSAKYTALGTDCTAR